jgi:TetR/AcrR family transcriptional regulator, transcriptional repressor for nem operon
MARVSKEQAILNRQHIVQVAARLYREHGLSGIGVADLMAQAGVTHGGFYGHFASKDALAGEAAASAFIKSAEKWEAIIAGHGASQRAALDEITSKYLSSSHCDLAGHGCTIPALAGDAARLPADAPLRLSFAAGLGRLTDILLSLMPQTYTKKRRRERALSSLALLVGAITIARATADQAYADEMLKAAKVTLSELTAP